MVGLEVVRGYGSGADLDKFEQQDWERMLEDESIFSKANMHKHAQTCMCQHSQWTNYGSGGSCQQKTTEPS